MKRISLLVAMAFAVSTFFSAQALAGDMHNMGMHEEAAMPSAYMHTFYQADDLMGKAVLGTDGQKIGEMKNFVIMKNGDVKYLLISKAGAAENEFIAVPWATMEGFTADTVRLNIASSKALNAPVFTELTFSPQMEQRIDAYYGVSGMEMSPKSKTEWNEKYGEEHQGMEKGTSGEYYGGSQSGMMMKNAEAYPKSDLGTSEMGAKGTMEASGQFFRSSDVLGRSVMSKDGKEIGKLHNIILGENGQAKYAIIAEGGFLGIGERKVAVPWSMVTVRPEEVMVSANEQKIKDAPEFSESKFDTQWENQVNAYYGAEPGASESGTYHERGEATTSEYGAKGETGKHAFLQTSDFIHKSMTDETGKEVGKVEDFILSKSGKIDYLLLSTDTTANGEFVAVPWQEFRFDPQTDRLMVMVSKDKIDNAPKLTENDLQKFNDPAWTGQLHSYYGITPEGMGNRPMPEGSMQKGTTSPDHMRGQSGY